MEAVDLTGRFSFGDSSLGDGDDEVKICKAATRGTSMITRLIDAMDTAFALHFFTHGHGRLRRVAVDNDRRAAAATGHSGAAHMTVEEYQ